MKTDAKKIGFSILYALSRAGMAIVNFFKDAFKHMPYAFHVVIHPFDGFFRLKTEKRHHSVPCAVLLYVFLAVSTVLRKQALNFMFTEDANLNINIFLDMLVSVLPYLLWGIANWCFTSLMDGDGSYRDIFCATGVALIPMTVCNILQIPLSYMLNLEESTIYTFVGGVGIFYTYALLFLGMIVTHQYSFGKGIVTAVLTILGMLTIAFVAILLAYLVQQIYDFVYDLASEIKYRQNE